MKSILIKKINAVTAGVLSAVIVSMSLAGCQSVNDTARLSSLAESSQPSSSAAVSSSSSESSKESAPVSSKPESVSSKAASSTASQSPASSAAAKPAQKVNQTTPVKSKTPSITVKKISDDKTAVNIPKLSVINNTALAAGYAHIDQRGGYNALPDLVSRNLYAQIAKSVYKVAATPTSEGYYPAQRVTVSGTQLSEAQLRMALVAFLNDNPQVFWIANVYSYGYSSDGSDTYVQLYSYVPQSQCNTMVQQLNNKISAIMKAMPSGLSELDRELYLFDYITKTNTYDNAAVSDTSRWKSFNAYGALIEGNVVCEGYSRAMQLLSSYSNLQCLLVTGQGSSVNHMWNIIRIDGNWYHLDITWSDNSSVLYNYFNVTDAVITQNHTVSPLSSSLSEAEIDGNTSGTPTQFNLFLPPCTATDANYFKAKGIRVTDLNGTDDSAVVAAVTSAVKQKKTSVSFYINENADYTSTVSGMVQTSPYKLAYYLNTANSQSGVTSKVSIGNVRYISDQADRGLTIFLSYK
jgi:transglutaminase/protease-like cytokinesis protein 3